MTTDKKPSTALLALGAAAAVLPAYAPPATGAVNWEADSGYRFSFYKEADLPSAATNGLDGERMEVLTHQFHLLAPVNETLDYSVDATVDTLTGASPWFIVPNASGRPIQIMSGATIDETRYAVQGRLRQHHDGGRRALQVGVSKEDDYLAISGGVEAEWDFNQQSQTLAVGIGLSHDELEPVEGDSAAFPDRIDKADKDSLTAYTGFTHAFDRHTVAQIGAAWTHGDGYLSDPYKRVYVAGDIIPDRRPGTRDAFALTARLRHYLPGLKAAVHVDMRYFADDWGIGSDTLEAAWVQQLPGNWRLTPTVRWYQQGHADFYRPYFNFTRGDERYSSDPRMSAFGALSGRVALQKEWQQWSFALSVEGYRSEGDFALRSVDSENPGLVEFGVVSLAFSYRWFSAPSSRPAAHVTPPPVRVIEVLP